MEKESKANQGMFLQLLLSIIGKDLASFEVPTCIFVHHRYMFMAVHVTVVSFEARTTIAVPVEWPRAVHEESDPMGYLVPACVLDEDTRLRQDREDVGYFA